MHTTSVHLVHINRQNLTTSLPNEYNIHPLLGENDREVYLVESENPDRESNRDGKQRVGDGAAREQHELEKRHEIQGNLHIHNDVIQHAHNDVI